MRRPWRRRTEPTFAENVERLRADVARTAQARRAERETAHLIEMTERAALPCVTCDDIGEPHVCERAYWQQRLDHYRGRTCADPDCTCHAAEALRAEAEQIERCLP